MTDDGRLQLDALDGCLTKRTKLVAVAAVSNVLGTINPMAEIIRRAHDAGAVVLVDGAQSVPHHEDRRAGPRLRLSGLQRAQDARPLGRRRALRQAGTARGDAAVPGRRRNDQGGDARRLSSRCYLPGKFEAGTPPIVPAIALGAAIDYLNAVGLEAIAEHERRLTQRAHEVLEAVGGLRIIGPAPEHKAGIVSFVFDSGRPHAHDVAQVLDRYGVAIRAGHHCTMPLHKRFGVTATARASFYFYNTLAEVDKLGEALEQVKRVFRRKWFRWPLGSCDVSGDPRVWSA